MAHHDPNLATDMQALLETQRAQSLKVPTAEERIDRINRLIDLIADNKGALADAVSADFGNRSTAETMIADIGGTLTELKHAKSHLAQWMKPTKAKVDFPLNLLGGKARIEYQPLGVIGIVAPWNFPIYLAIGPMGEAFAAGNSVMLKPSEFTPATSSLLKTLIEQSFALHEAAVITGGVEAGVAFTKLPFDHLLFTGATSIGKHILHAAADNLVPVTLELGGKSPAIITSHADQDTAAARIASGKLFNAGQVCLAPDYALIPRSSLHEFVATVQGKIAAAYPTLQNNPDYTHIVSDRQLDRLKALVSQARNSGAEVIEVNPAGEDLSAVNEKVIAPTIIVDPSPDLDVMTDEIFGPILPVVPYDTLDEAIDFVNARPRPLALYVFSADTSEQNKVLQNTTSGGACINDTIMHSTQQSLPFGGVGPSGMGSYHGHYGFKLFSHEKAVYKQINMDSPFKPLRAPFADKFKKAIAPMLKK
jgi:coniferyl-aldehyde dehydrogenase